MVAGGLSFTAIAAGVNHTCGLTSGGVAYCWGSNYLGQLGVADTSSRSTPTAVDGGLPFAALTAGWYHNCGLTATGATHCWGHDESGQLGDGAPDMGSANRLRRKRRTHFQSAHCRLLTPVRGDAYRGGLLLGRWEPGPAGHRHRWQFDATVSLV